MRFLHVLVYLRVSGLGHGSAFTVQSKVLTCHLVKANSLRQCSLAKEEMMLSVFVRMSEVLGCAKYEALPAVDKMCSLPQKENVYCGVS